jgi:tetratricopeptide (TPR) repeat protein
MNNQFPQTLGRYLVLSVIFGLIWSMTGCSGNSQECVESGNKYPKEKQYEEAAPEFRNALESDPQSTKPHYHLGFAYLAIGSFEDVIQKSPQTIGIDSNPLEAQL